MTGLLNPPHVFQPYAEGVSLQSPGSPALRRTLGNDWLPNRLRRRRYTQHQPEPKCL